MIRSNPKTDIMLEAHRQFAQSLRLGLGWDWPRAMRFAHHKIAGKRTSIEAQMAKIAASVRSYEFSPGRYGHKKGI